MSYGTKSPASAEGVISYQFSSDCDFYAQNLRQAIDMQPQEGQRQVSESRVSTYEDERGQDFRFATAEVGAPAKSRAARNAAATGRWPSRSARPSRRK